MPRSIGRILPLLAAFLMLAAAPASGGEGSPPVPGGREKCPVCGMFVSKYPEFLSAIRFTDGSYAWFDGPKDLFRFLLGLKRFAPARRPEEVEAVLVKEYYSLESVDGRKAFYVTGSDVYGPMGKELVPFRREEDARQFLKDHKGKSILRFREVTTDMLEALQ